MTGPADAAPMSDDVTVTHPDVPDPLTVRTSRARILVRQGWEYADSAHETSTPPGDGNPPPPPSDADPGDDPSLED